MTPSIYVSCLAAYNNGHLHGKWIECDLGADVIREEIKEVLASSPIPNAEEWAIHDFENFGSFKVEEYSGIDEIAEYADAIKEHGEIIGEIMAWRGCTVDEAIETLQDHYCGEYQSEVDFAEEFTKECGHEVPKWLEYYIDWEAVARDMFINDFHSIEMNGSTHVFHEH